MDQNFVVQSTKVNQATQLAINSLANLRALGRPGIPTTACRSHSTSCLEIRGVRNQIRGSPKIKRWLPRKNPKKLFRNFGGDTNVSISPISLYYFVLIDKWIQNGLNLSPGMPGISKVSILCTWLEQKQS